VFIELVDALRCPRTHEESWLVLAMSRIEARHIQEGALGCPVCHAEYPIHHGIVDLRLDDTESAPARAGSAHDASRLPDHVAAYQLAAMLDLADAVGFVVLVGEWGRHAHALLGLDQVPPLLLIDPPDDVVMGAGLSGVRAGVKLPLAVGAARAVAVDGIDPIRLASAAQTTRAGGRVVAPAQAGVPEGVRELARDERVWVGEREAPPSELVRLHVRRG
jgi:uncharacterized protein YbaR (Trm112 family)